MRQTFFVNVERECRLILWYSLLGFPINLGVICALGPFMIDYSTGIISLYWSSIDIVTCLTFCIIAYFEDLNRIRQWRREYLEDKYDILVRFGVTLLLHLCSIRDLFGKFYTYTTLLYILGNEFSISSPLYSMFWLIVAEFHYAFVFYGLIARWRTMMYLIYFGIYCGYYFVLKIHDKLIRPIIRRRDKQQDR